MWRRKEKETKTPLPYLPVLKILTLPSSRLAVPSGVNVSQGGWLGHHAASSFQPAVHSTSWERKGGWIKRPGEVRESPLHRKQRVGLGVSLWLFFYLSLSILWSGKLLTSLTLAVSPTVFFLGLCFIYLFTGLLLVSSIRMLAQWKQKPHQYHLLLCPGT